MKIRSKRTNPSALRAAALAAVVVGLGMGAAALAAQPGKAKYGVEFPPQWTAQGELVQPKDFRQWIFIGSPMTPHGLNDGKANFPEFHNVYVQPSAFKLYRKTGTWPEGTMMVKELQLVQPAQFPDGSRTEVSGRGYFPAGVAGLDIAVKDSSRFKESKNWGYFNYGHHAPPYLRAAAAAPVAACAGCHMANAHEDMVYIKFYKSILDPLPVKK